MIRRGVPKVDRDLEEDVEAGTVLIHVDEYFIAVEYESNLIDCSSDCAMAPNGGPKCTSVPCGGICWRKIDPIELLIMKVQQEEEGNEFTG